MSRTWTALLRLWTPWRRSPTANPDGIAAPPATVESISRNLAQWLVPYLVLWLLFAWRILDWPASGHPLGPGIDCSRFGWILILIIEVFPVLALVPQVWRFTPAYVVIGLAIHVTVANDLMFFCQTLIKAGTPLVFLTSVLSVVKACFDMWVFCRLNERWDVWKATRRQASI